MRLGIVTVVFAAVIGLGTAQAEVKTNASGKVSVDIPSAWKIETNPKVPGMMTAESKDKAVGLIFWVLDKGDIKEAVGLLDKALEGKVADWKWQGKPAEANLDGMKGIKNVGTAKVEGKDAFVMVAVVGPTPSKKTVLIFGAIEQSKLTEHKAELSNIFDSIKKTK